MRDLERRLAFLRRSGINEVRLLGGEPTLHPEFAGLVEACGAVAEEITIFSNGLMPSRALECLASLPPQACTVVVNVAEPGDDGTKESHRRQKETLRRLGRRAILGFTIYRTEFEPAFLLDLVTETGCSPLIRLGMAQPCLSGSNRYIHPKQYRAIAVKIARFARAAAGAGVGLDLDCGFVRCMFSDEDLEALRGAGADPAWRCSPILDVDLQGQVIHCYPLSRLMRLPLTAGAEATALRHTFEARTRPYRRVGVYAECSACALKAAGACSGGCLATTIRRLRPATLRLDLPEIEQAPR